MPGQRWRQSGPAKPTEDRVFSLRISHESPKYFAGTRATLVLHGAAIGVAQRPKKELGKILISCLDVSNKIWLTVEMAKMLFATAT